MNQFFMIKNSVLEFIMNKPNKEVGCRFRIRQISRLINYIAWVKFATLLCLRSQG